MRPDVFTKSVDSRMIDYSGHLNVGYYLLIFEEAAVQFTDTVGLGHAYRLESNRALFVTETHLTFEREVREGDLIEIEWRVLGVSRKAFNIMYLMRLTGSEAIHATNEVLYLHMDLGARKATEIPAAQKRCLEELCAEHGKHGLPAQAGRRITLRS